MARMVVVSNRVGIPNRDGGAQAGGLEVVLALVPQAQPGPLVRLERQERAPRARSRSARSSIAASPTSRPTLRAQTSRNTTTALPTACCGRSCTTGSISWNSPAATWPATCGSTSISPTSCRALLKPDDVIWVHDYHFLPLAKALRDRGVENKIGFFLHIPFPPPDLLTALPKHERTDPAACATTIWSASRPTTTPTIWRDYLDARVPDAEPRPPHLHRRPADDADRRVSGRRRDRWSSSGWRAARSGLNVRARGGRRAWPTAA